MTEHLLFELALPDRYERLAEKLGNEVSNLLVSPQLPNIIDLHSLAADVITRDEGVLVPVYGETGTGKTTFVENVDQWSPTSYGPTLTYDGPIEFDTLTEAARAYSRGRPANNKRILPINIDHRESNPPTDAELATIKRFLRTKSAGVPSVIFLAEYL